MMTGARTKTDEALQANIPAITSTLANRSPVVTEVGQAGEVACDVLVAQRNEAQDIADKLYETNRGSGPAFVDQDASLAMVKTLTNKLSEGYDFANIPKISKLFARHV